MSRNSYRKEERFLKDVAECQFLRYLNIGLQLHEPGIVKATMVTDNNYLQHHGYIHGGVITTLADSVAGFAAISITPDQFEVVTVELKISFLKPGKGRIISALGWVIKPGNKFHFCEAEIKCNDIIIAKASATMAIV